MAKPQQILSEREKGLITVLTAEGTSQSKIAKALGMPLTTFRDVLVYNGLSATIQKARRSAIERVEASLFKKALGWKHRAVKIFCSATGNVTKVAYTERFAPSDVAGIFLLVNLMSDKYKNVAQILHKGPGKDGSFTFEDSTRYRDALVAAFSRAVTEDPGLGKPADAQPDGITSPGVAS